jgi:hypothetical protein
VNNLCQYDLFVCQVGYKYKQRVSLMKITSGNVNKYIYGTEVKLSEKSVYDIAADTFRGLTHITIMYISDDLCVYSPVY